MAKEGFEPVQVTQIASQKNGADIRLAIDAMDLLHSNTFGGFVIVSSDSDFSSLALRIRQQGIRVFGIGEERALDGYQRAFTKFVVVGEPAATNVAPACANPIDRLLAKAFAELSPDLSVAPLNQIGQAIRKIEPNYSHQSFGGKTLSSVIALSDNFKVIEGNRVQRK